MAIVRFRVLRLSSFFSLGCLSSLVGDVHDSKLMSQVLLDDMHCLCDVGVKLAGRHALGGDFPRISDGPTVPYGGRPAITEWKSQEPNGVGE